MPHAGLDASVTGRKFTAVPTPVLRGPTTLPSSCQLPISLEPGRPTLTAWIPPTLRCPSKDPAAASSCGEL